MISRDNTDELKAPEKWYSSIEKSRQKAQTLLKDLVAVHLNTSIVVGVLDEISIDRLSRISYPFCKLTLTKTQKFSLDGKLESKKDTQLCFVNKPEMIMEIADLQKEYPEIHEEVHIQIKKNAFGI